MLVFLTLMNITFAILNLTVSEEVLDSSFYLGIFDLLVACFTAYVWGANS